MAGGYITLSYSTTSNGATSATVAISMYYYGNGVSHNEDTDMSQSITFNGSTQSFKHTFSTSTSAQLMGTKSWTVTKTHSSQSLTASGSMYTAVSLGTLTATCKVSISAKTSYTVSYNANGGSGAPSAQTKWYGETLTLSTTKPTRTGYTFDGWYTASSGGSKYGTTYTANASATLYAHWTILTYTVSYNANGGSGAPSAQTKTYGTDLKLSSTVPTRSGYDFLGWATSSTGSVAYSAGDYYKTNSDVTLYAIWKLSTYTVKFNANGGQGAISNKSYEIDKSYTLPSASGLSREDYTFLGWSTSSTATNPTYTDRASVKNLTSAGSTITLYAVWQELSCTIIYYEYGGTTHSTTVRAAHSVKLGYGTTPSDFNNYTFSGYWKFGTTAPASSTDYAITDLYNDDYSPYVTHVSAGAIHSGQTYYAAAVYKRKSSLLGRTTYASYNFIRASHSIPASAFKVHEGYPNAESFLMNQHRDNGKCVCGYIKFSSSYSIPSDDSIRNLAGNVTSGSNFVGITPSQGITTALSNHSIINTIVVDTQSIYIYINVENTDPTLSYDLSCTLTNIVNDFAVPVTFNGEITFLVNIPGINYIVDVNKNGTMLTIGGLSSDDLTAYKYTKTDSGNEVQAGRVTGLFNPVFTLNEDNEIIPVMSEGRVEDKILLSDTTIEKWTRILNQS